jgi:hypothetical protein
MAISLSMILGLSVLYPAMRATPARADTTFFTTGAPDGRMAMASRPASSGNVETKAADDFILSSPTSITGATFTGLIPTGLPLSNVQAVRVEIYRVFPLDSANPPSGNVPIRVNSPSDVEFAHRDSAGASLSYSATVLNMAFTAANSVDLGINHSPNQTTGGEGPVTGQEVQFNVTFSGAFALPADHYFFIPQVQLTSEHFYWLSALGPPIFTGDLQTWIRNSALDPDWLRVGTDVVGGATPPKFNASFSLLSAPDDFTITGGAAISGLTEGAQSTFTIGAIHDPDHTGSSDWTVTVGYGDGTSDSCTVSGANPCTFTSGAAPAGSPGVIQMYGCNMAGCQIQVTHTYKEESESGTPYIITISGTDADQATQPASATSTAQVNDNSLGDSPGNHLTNPSGGACNQFSPCAGLLTSFADSNSFCNPGNGTTPDEEAISPVNGAPHYIVTVNYGDGSGDQLATAFTEVGSTCVFNIYGSHTYTAPNTYTVTVTITDEGCADGGTGCSITITSTVNVVAPTGVSPSATNNLPYETSNCPYPAKNGVPAGTMNCMGWYQSETTRGFSGHAAPNAFIGSILIKGPGNVPTIACMRSQTGTSTSGCLLWVDSFVCAASNHAVVYGHTTGSYTAFFKIDDYSGNVNTFQYQDSNGVNLTQQANNVVLGC